MELAVIAGTEATQGTGEKMLIGKKNVLHVTSLTLFRLRKRRVIFG
jgi:hypothetical protein